jgi:ATP-dependent DNA ligase
MGMSGSASFLALNESGRPDFSLLQHFRNEASRIHYFIFDLLVCEGRDLTHLPLITRREILSSYLAFKLPRIRLAEYFEASAENILAAARGQRARGRCRQAQG